MIETEDRGPTRWVFMANPQILNAVGVEDLQRLREEVQRGLDSPSVSLVVLAGRAGNFCAGDNLKESGAMDRAQFRSLIAAFQELAWVTERASKPLAALVEGYALGGGAEIALMCDFVVAEPSAVIGCPEVALGGMISNGSAAFLAHSLGVHRASELVLLSRRWRADDPALSGLLNYVGSREECVRWLDEAAARLSESPASAVKHAREAIRGAGREERLVALSEELMHAMELFGDPSYKEATAAFARGERRQGEVGDGPAPDPDR